MGVSEIAQLVSLIRELPRCHVLPPSGPPTVPPELRLPVDVAKFYEVCGGLRLFSGSDFESTVASPDRFLPANPVILGADVPADRSDDWFVAVYEDSYAVAVIDLSPSRNGRCYDAFHEVYGVAGSMAVIAESFTQLVRNLVDSRGGHWYRLEPEWAPLGDAYE